MDNPQVAIWQGLASIQTQASKLILGLNPAAKTRLLSF